MCSRNARALLAICLFSTRPAAAQAPGDEERAQQLFVEGHAAADRQDLVLACAKFSESLRLFRRASTLLNLGMCHEGLGRTATALRYWREGTALLEPTDARMELALSRIADLDRRAPRLRVMLPATLPVAAVVTLDGEAVSRASLAEELRLDPGPHALLLAAPGYPTPPPLAVTLPDGDAKTVTLALGTPLAPPTPERRSAPAPLPIPARVPPDRAGEHTVPVWAWPAGAIGLTATGAAIALAVDYSATLARQQERCGGDLERCRPTPTGSYDPADDNARKRRDAILGTVLGVAGGAGVVAAAIGAIVGEGGVSRAAITIRPDVDGATVVGRF